MITITFDNAAEKAAGIGALAGRVATVHTHDWAEGVAQAGETSIRGIARVDTGIMQGSIGSFATAAGGVGVAEAGYGVQSYNPPFYTKFQEFGTRHGITPMQSVIGGVLAMGKEIHDGGDKMMMRIAAEWDAI